MKETNSAKMFYICKRLVFLGFNDIMDDIEKYDRLTDSLTE